MDFQAQEASPCWSWAVSEGEEAQGPQGQALPQEALLGEGKRTLFFSLTLNVQVEMRKLLKQHEEKTQKGTVEEPQQGAVPAYLLDRQRQTTGSVLSTMIKEKRKQKAVRT